MLPKLVVIQSARAFEATVNPRGQIVLAFGFDWHVHKMPLSKLSYKQTVFVTVDP